MNETEHLDPGGVAAGLRIVLAAVDAGEMAASDTTRARLEGAVVALDLLAGHTVAEIVERLARPNPATP